MSDSAYTAEDFDRWYADLDASTARDDLEQRHLGLSPELSRTVTGLVPLDGLAAVTSALWLAPDELLLDLACGQGGYGLEVASRTRARLLGIDFSAEAVRQATAEAARQERDATFRVGSLTDTGLEDASVDAVICLDSVQFAERPDAAYAEVARVLRPGGRLVLTAWEPRDAADEQVPASMRRLRLADGLVVAGFEDVEVEECDDWAAQERALWEEARGTDPGGDPALEALRDEALSVLATFDRVQRVMASGTRRA
ncbi:Methyltransferase domain-containing protein [Nocardioides scoriae]|uniref:Methyltransferase domain-containing protein n=1 Tax=Nocardioides scoriae TaxID=642780 RepID=A0A1H1Q6R4_9ACTN|nr:class I SAM-dependent methyltransferase [Nocardioides scoriae]SDS19201.1 Methyltransferase domain-containing protein [Nocardioides scoriae]